MTHQSAVFLQVYLLPDKVDELQNLLDTGGNPATSGNFFDFSKLKSVHFARWLIAPATSKFKASLIYSGNVDGSVDDHLKDLSTHFAKDLDALFSCCEGYPAPENRSTASQLAFLKSHSKKTPAFYVGAPNRTVEQIHQEAALHEAVKEFVKTNKGKWTTAIAAREAIQHFLTAPEFDWARKAPGKPQKKGFKMVLFLLLLLMLSPFLLLGVLGIFLFYEWREKPYGKSIDQVSMEHLKELKEQEDRIYQNQLSQVFETKGGLRKLMLKFLLWATNFAAKNWFVEGNLMGTPTIHFARWVFIDGGKRFVFFSNFDGSYNGYLGDFVDNNGWGLNAIYGAAVGYPKSTFMFGGGSYKILEFMGWGRQTQVPTGIWYSAYPWYGLQQIVSKSELRLELFDEIPKNNEQIRQMLKRI